MARVRLCGSDLQRLELVMILDVFRLRRLKMFQAKCIACTTHVILLDLSHITVASQNHLAIVVTPSLSIESRFHPSTPGAPDLGARGCAV